MEMSDAVKSVEGSEREKERVATSPVFRVVILEVSMIVGGTTVSTVRVRVLLAFPCYNCVGSTRTTCR